MSDTQKELEQPAKVYQLNSVAEKLDLVLDRLDKIESQTKGVVTFEQMEQYVRNYVTSELKEHIMFKKNVVKWAWWVGTTISTLLVADIATRLYK